MGARGVVFVFLKFCDPHGFDYPYIKSMLDEAGIPSMLFEIEDRLPAEGQLRTRIEAFWRCFNRWLCPFALVQTGL